MQISLNQIQNGRLANGKASDYEPYLAKHVNQEILGSSPRLVTFFFTSNKFGQFPLFFFLPPIFVLQST